MPKKTRKYLGCGVPCLLAVLTACVTESDEGAGASSTTRASSSSATTQSSSSAMPPGYCGDGRTDADEICDGEGLPRISCEDLGYEGGFLRCTDDCRYDEASCWGRCGNGSVDESEACDGPVPPEADCTDFGFVAPEGLACASDCARFDTSFCKASCNGVLEPGEGCDVDVAPDRDCTDFGYVSPAGLGCQQDCAFDTAHCVPVCGNAVIEPGESCDDGNTIGGDGCSARCRREPMSCADANQFVIGGSAGGLLGGEGVEDASICSAPGSDRIHFLVAPSAGTLQVTVWTDFFDPEPVALSLRTACDDITSVVACTQDATALAQTVETPVSLGQIVYVYVDALDADATRGYSLLASML